MPGLVPVVGGRIEAIWPSLTLPALTEVSQAWPTRTEPEA